MSAAAGLPTNSYSCHWDDMQAEAMLRRFADGPGMAATLLAGFGLDRCSHRVPSDWLSAVHAVPTAWTRVVSTDRGWGGRPRRSAIAARPS